MFYLFERDLSKKRTSILLLLLLFFIAGTILFQLAGTALAANTTYYVSSSGGDDTFSGLDRAAPLKSIARVNQLNLEQGDRVLFKCGDLWQGEMIRITDSGSSDNPITYGSYPGECENRPVLSGALPIGGWIIHSENIYVSDLSTGANEGKFSNGINQLFRMDIRLPLGRWPNMGEMNNGYTLVDEHSSFTAQITDNELPAVDWTGAAMHIKGMQWYIMNREIVATEGAVMTLNHDVFCYEEGNCTGWGYFLNSHFNTLDQEGEWYYDAATNRVYLYTLNGAPADNELEGSVILIGESEYDITLGAIVTGQISEEHISNIIIENFHIKNWFQNGITTPTSLELNDNSNIVIRNNLIEDVQETGIHLMTWIWNAGADSGMRGGKNITVQNNVITGANRHGINTYTVESVFTENEIRNIGLIENLSREGMGCEFDTIEECTTDGVGLVLYVHEEQFSGRDNVIEGNIIERTAMDGMEIFGPKNRITGNYVREACYAKADCGAIRVYGENSLEEPVVYDITIEDNIVVDTIGNTDGCREDYLAPLFGFGIYTDHYARNVVVSDNTVIGGSAGGILFWWRSTGTVTGNTLYNNGTSGPNYPYRPGNAQIEVWDYDIEPGTAVSMSDNIMYGIKEDEILLRVSSTDNLTSSDNNYFFNPYTTLQVDIWEEWPYYTFDQWKTLSGMDQNSTANWFTLAPGDEPLSEIFYNPSGAIVTIDLDADIYEDLDRNTVFGSIELQPYSSLILIHTGASVSEPLPDIKINGSDSDIILNKSSNLAITIELDPGSRLSENADWWLVAYTLRGWYFYNENTGQWSSNAVPFRQGALYTIDTPESILSVSTSNLPSGSYHFYFGVDTVMNMQVDYDVLFFDNLNAVILP